MMMLLILMLAPILMMVDLSINAFGRKVICVAVTVLFRIPPFLIYIVYSLLRLPYIMMCTLCKNVPHFLYECTQWVGVFFICPILAGAWYLWLPEVYNTHKEILVIAHYFLHVASIMNKTCWTTLSNVLPFVVVLIVGWLLIFAGSETFEYIFRCDIYNCYENRVVYFSWLCEMFFWWCEYWALRIVAADKMTLSRGDLSELNRDVLQTILKQHDGYVNSQMSKQQIVDALIE